MSQIVEYVLSLRDDLSKGIQGANANVNHLESSLGSAKSALGSLGSMLGTLGVGFAIFKGAEFIHEGVEAMHVLEQATAKVEANLKSTKESAGIGMAEITDMAKKLSKQVQFSRAEVMDMQSQLLTFPSITKDVFEQSMGMVTDIAKQTNHGLSETAIMFGKAFANPEEGLQKLMRYGVMFTDAQKEMVTKLQESGNIVKAQKYMLDAIATSGYAGVAKAMADADPLFQYNKLMGSIKMEVGETAMAFLKDLTPALESFAKSIKEAIVFLKEHWDIIKKVTLALGTFFISFKLFSGVPALFLSIESALLAAASGGSIFGAVMTAALGPVGLLSIAVAGLVYAYQSVGEAKTLAEKEKATDFEKANIYINSLLDSDVTFYEKSMDKKSAIAKAKAYEIADLQTKFSQANDLLDSKQFKGEDSNSNQSQAYKDAVRNANNLNEQIKTANSYSGLIPDENAAKKEKKGKEVTPPPATKATGSKSVTINVSIKDLVNSLQINTTNLKEGAGKIQDMVANALAGAVNDFQIIAGGH